MECSRGMTGKRMTKRMTTAAAALMSAAVLVGCAQVQQTAETISEGAAEEVQEAVTEAVADTIADSAEETEEAEEQLEEADDTVIRVGSLKGPTTMGIVNLMKSAEEGEESDSYQFTMETAADVLLAEMVSDELDIALIPANVASILYQKTEGGIAVADINTLGVLYCVTGDEEISSVADLSGQTVITTGQGATPEYAIRYLLSEYGVDDCELEFKAEATEVAAALAADPGQIAVLPQPFATVAQVQNEVLQEAFSLTEEWDALENGSRMITGVTVVRRSFLEEHADAVERFVKAHADSAAKAAEDPEGTAQLIAEYGIIEKATIAQKALPKCGITCITGEEMKEALSGYLATLYEQDAKSVGGQLPDEDFYAINLE